MAFTYSASINAHFVVACLIISNTDIPPSMTHGNIQSSPPEMSKLRALLFLLSMLYFTIINFICRLVSVFIKKRVVPKTEDRLLLMSATKAAKMIRERKITSIELIEAYINRIEQVNGAINAIAEDNFADARQKAYEADAILESIEREGEEYTKLIAAKPLLGVPFTVKDCIEAAGLRCTVGLASRKDVKAVEDATVIRRIKNAGAILLAVTNVPEVCMWWESSNTIYGRVSNPYDTRRTAGGSSGGEGALISACGSVIGLASDIGGSIRMPSFFNGVFGFKPTPGVVPLSGHQPQVEGYMTEMLRIGPICRYAEDLELILKVSAVYVSWNIQLAVEHFERKYDLCAIRLDLPFVHKALDFYFASMEVPGVAPPIHAMTELDSDVDCAFELAKFVLGLSSHTLAAITMAVFENRTLFSEERKRTSDVDCAFELAKFVLGLSSHTLAAITMAVFENRTLFSEERKRTQLYIMTSGIFSFFQIIAQRDRLHRELNELLQANGILLFPSFPTLVPFHNQPLLTPFNFAYTSLWNALALPVVQCPLGLSRHSLPIGVQVIGAPASDRLLIAVARDLEQAFGGWKPLIDR
uniref:Amidase domain-containing protein n=1 Tax=Ascaris lumbricoides TaxID=6252 RepID=A0A9J2QA68_ASCLU